MTKTSAILVSKWLRLPDPRKFGSGNPGATNVLRTGNKKAAALTLLGDLLKGLLPILAGRWLQFDILLLCCIGLAAILGHMYPVYYGFRGGKGVATTLGVLVGIAWPLALVWALIWSGVAKFTRYSSLAALLATISLPFISWWLNYTATILIFTFAINILVIWRHRVNIKRLIRGEESRIGTSN